MESHSKSSPPKIGVVSVEGVGDKGLEVVGGLVVTGGSVVRGGSVVKVGSVTGGLGIVKVGFVVVVDVVSVKMGVGICIEVKG